MNSSVTTPEGGTSKMTTQDATVEDETPSMEQVEPAEDESAATEAESPAAESESPAVESESPAAEIEGPIQIQSEELYIVRGVSTLRGNTYKCTTLPTLTTCPPHFYISFPLVPLAWSPA